MNITSKFIYAKTKAAFEAQLPSIPQNLNPIVFIEDTREMWTMGTYFSIGYPAIQVSETQGVVKVDIASSFFTISTSGASLSIQKGAGNDIIISSNALTRVDTAAPLEWDVVTKRLLHSVSGASAGTYGQSTATENASILNIPYITVNNTGHITSISTKAVSIRDYVEQLAPNELLGDRNVLISYNEANTNSDTAQVRKARGLTFNSLSQILTIGGGANINGPTNVTNGDLTVTGGDIVGNLRGNVTGEATPKIHLSLNPEYGGASKNLYGHVKLLDLFGAEAPPQSSDNSDVAASTIINGVAASPYLVWETKRVLQENIDSSLQTSKTYAESLFAANDALVFKGGITGSGIIISKDPLVNGKTIGQLTDYSAGWTFKTTTAIEITGIGKLEEGDLVIALTDAVTYSASDWTVVQTNIDGAVVAIDTLTASQLLIGDSGTRTIKTLAPGSEGQVLRINSSLVPYWASTDAQTWRTIKVKGIEVLANTTSTSLDFEQGNGISLSWNSLTNAVSIAFNGDILQNTLQALTIASTSISVGSYNPTGTTDNVLNFTDGLTASLSNNIFKVGHSNSVSTQVTKAVRSFSYDAHGHITASDIVSSLPNSFALKFLSNDSATELMTYDGSELKNIRFINGNNVNISPSYNALTKTIEYTISSGATVDTWRTIKVAGVERLANSVSTALDFESGTGITLGWNAATSAVTIAFNSSVLSSSIQALTINSSATPIGSYNPTLTTDNTFNFTNGLNASLNNNVFTIGHSNSVVAGVKKLYSFAFDAHGHITGTPTEVTSLPNASALSLFQNDGTTLITSYDGSAVRSFRFVNGTDITMTPTLSGTQVTYTLGLTHRYRPISFYPTSTGTLTALFTNAQNNTLVLKPGNSNISIANIANELVISTVNTNTWRNISAYRLSDNTLAEILSSSIGTDDLQFGSEFLWDTTGKELKLGWAEVAADGTTITYSI